MLLFVFGVVSARTNAPVLEAALSECSGVSPQVLLVAVSVASGHTAYVHLGDGTIFCGLRRRDRVANLDRSVPSFRFTKIG